MIKSWKVSCGVHQRLFQPTAGWIMFCNVLMEFLPHVRDINSADPSTSMPPLLGGPSHDLQGVVHHHAALAGVPDQLQFQQAFQGQQPASPLTVSTPPHIFGTVAFCIFCSVTNGTAVFEAPGGECQQPLA